LRDPGQAENYLKMGVQHFCIGWDVRILHDWWRVNGAGMRAMLTGAQPTETARTKQPAGTY